MKKLLVILALAVAAVAPSAVANTITLANGPFHLKPGGIFTATSTGVINQTYNTFCVESAVGFHLGVTYTYNLSQVDHSGNPLTLGTAWLYRKYIDGAFAITSNAMAGELQAAIWHFQSQTLDIPVTFPSGAPGNPFTDLVDTALGANAWKASNGVYGVDIVELWAGRTPAQSMLHVPDGGATMALLGVGLIALAAIRRRIF